LDEPPRTGQDFDDFSVYLRSDGDAWTPTDPTQLDRWFDRALTAGTAAEVFAD
jgi:hypothetical protein